jgi:chitodextrinase
VERSTIVLVVALLVWGLMAACSAACAAAVLDRPVTAAALQVAQLTPTSATLTWTQSSSTIQAEGYRIYRGPVGATAADLTLIETIDPSTSYTATSLRSGVGYVFGVAAVDLSNNQEDMRLATVQIPASDDATPPNPPSDASVHPFPFSASRIDIVWADSKSADVASYEIRRNGDLVGTVERPNAQAFSDNGLAASSSYSYTVTAVDSAGNRSPATSAKSATTLADGELKIVRGPYSSSVTQTSAIVSWWTNVPSPGSVAVGDQVVTDPSGMVQHHAVTVSGLAASTSYSYSVSSGSESRDGSFRSAAAPGQPFSFAAIGDFGSGGVSQVQNASNIVADGTQFIQTLGDNVYPSAGLPDPDFSTKYSDLDSRFYEPMGAALATQPLFPANGNKEYYAGGAFWDNFPMPGSNHSWYSYNWGDAHIIVLDTEQPFAPGSAQYDFVLSDLAAHQSEVWRIAVFQRPPYSSTSDYSSSPAVQSSLVPVFQSHKVSLVLSGNSHNYERTLPLIGGVPVSKGGIVYVVSGAGGNGFNIFSSTAPAYTAYREDDKYEFVKVTVTPSALQIDAVSAEDGAVFDSTTVASSSADTTPPAAVTGLMVVSSAAAGVSLSWSPSSDDVAVADYEVHRDGGPTPVGTVEGTTFLDSGLEPDHSYTYTVVAVDAAGNRSPPSFAVSVKPAGSGAGSADATVAGAPGSARPTESADPHGDCDHGTISTTSAGTGAPVSRYPSQQDPRRGIPAQVLLMQTTNQQIILRDPKPPVPMT